MKASTQSQMKKQKFFKKERKLTMKTLTKIFAMAMALIMILSMATTAFAATIKIDDKDVNNAKYGAYKLLNATDLGDGKYTYSVNADYRTVLQQIVGENKTDAEIIDYISAQTGDATQTFADAVYEKIKAEDPDYSTETNIFSDVDQGYYLIVETEVGSAEGFDKDTYSLVMLDTAGEDEITVETKEELPQSEKKVKDANDSTGEKSNWQDAADHDIGDKVPFQITFVLPEDFDEYENYFVGIHDTQAKGLTYNNDLTVTVNGDESKDLTTAFEYAAVDACTGRTCTFHIECDDIIAAATAAGITLNPGDKIVFEYTSTLNEEAEFGATGNPNEMTIEFSNNPYGDGTSETPKDRVIVFTYKVDVNKYAEKVEAGNELKGAGFTLYKEVPAGTPDAKTGAAIKADFDRKVKATDLDNNKYYVIACVVETDADGDTFKFNGVDDGTYVLVETTIPEGYNAWDAVEFEITAEHDIESAMPKLTELKGGDLVSGEFHATGIIVADIINKSGFELPSTGGIGTTIFYVVGGLLAVAAVVLLVTKKRMNSAK
jgi:fimbrial isopeptide formation D2 family protein/LPXTG-motif cell wall-anchored protein